MFIRNVERTKHQHKHQKLLPSKAYSEISNQKTQQRTWNQSRDCTLCGYLTCCPSLATQLIASQSIITSNNILWLWQSRRFIISIDVDRCRWMSVDDILGNVHVLSFLSSALVPPELLASQRLASTLGTCCEAPAAANPTTLGVSHCSELLNHPNSTQWMPLTSIYCRTLPLLFFPSV